MPRHARRQALKSALLGKLRDNEVVVLRDLEAPVPKTRDIVATLRSLKVTAGCLLVVRNHDDNVLKSCRNIPDADLSVYTDINAYSLLRRKQVVFTKAALQALAEEVGK